MLPRRLLRRLLIAYAATRCHADGFADVIFITCRHAGARHIDIAYAMPDAAADTLDTPLRHAMLRHDDAAVDARDDTPLSLLLRMRVDAALRDADATPMLPLRLRLFSMR